MSNRRLTWFYALLIAMTSAAAALVIASRLGLSPESSAQTVAAPAMNSAPLSGPVTATTFRDIAKLATPAVVNIRTESRQRAQDLSDFFGGGGGGGGDLFDRFFGQPGPGGQGQREDRSQPGARPREQVVQAAGTGFIIDKAGFILTNNHVVEGATKIKVSLYGEDEDQEYDAKVVGRDPLSDSALIELTEKPNHTLPEIKFGDSSQMQQGDWVMAIGNPFGLAHTVSVGVISALERPFQVAESRFAQVLQTDAAINPGNSGGPLLNLRGEVIGINTAIIADGRQSGNIGIGFAIPINAVRELLPQLRSGKITRGRIGVSVGAIERDAVDEFGLKDRKGAVVRSVTPGSAASRAGLEPGDVVVSFNGKPVSNRDELVRMVVNTRPGTTVPVRLMRDRAEKTVNVTVDELDLEAEGNGTRNNAERESDTAQETSSGFGITLQNVTPDVARRLKLDDTRGALIRDVEQGGAAARAGLRPGDVIVRVGRQAVASAADAQRELGRVPSRGTAFLRVVRDGQETFVSVTKE
ncbi:MAG TPA: trypsin-like peptidase domain-containing protein [Vicinamibacterales bacterium]|nr:trypsin-like peptidase domain-containing protein [Vicinamibacterales bacterium]